MKLNQDDVFSLLKVKPSPQSLDFVYNKKQFQLHNLVTEQPHPRTWDLSFVLKEDVEKGLNRILSVDEDVSRKFKEIAKNSVLLEQASKAVERALRERRKIFIYGCGATGRLAKQMESALWRPFWRKVKKSLLWRKLKSCLSEHVEELLIGEMTGGDRALISALEGLEDLQLMGELQFKEQGVKKGDVVFCITEGGETCSVIGAMLAAAKQYGQFTPGKVKEARENLYFIYNNPDKVLKPFTRSQKVIENPAVSKINLTTGPQAIAGSTRMQAVTSETFIMGLILEEGIFRALKDLLTQEELDFLGFHHRETLREKLLSFEELRKKLIQSLEETGRFTLLESKVYREGKFSTYFAQKALLTVFVDCAERSPTFHLYPLDTAGEKERKCWFQVWTEGKDFRSAWENFLGRRFKGLEDKFYRPHFFNKIQDTYLRRAAVQSLSQAGNDQEKLYDFSFSPENIARRGPNQGDLGVLVCMDEEVDKLQHHQGEAYKFINLFKKKKAYLALILVGNRSSLEIKKVINKLPLDENIDVIININLKFTPDPLKLKRQILLKLLLNAHSTGVMARLGKVVGNTMTNVHPGNLKLIGRATHLIMSHVNNTLAQKEWIERYGKRPPLTYAQANALLFQAMEFVSKKKAQYSEVELSIIRAVEALRKKKYVSWEEALCIAQSMGLESYLGKYNPHLRP